MNFLHRSLLLAVFLLSAASVPSFGDPVIINGGFETGNFAGWTLVGNPSDTFVSSAIENHGSYAAALGARNLPGTLSQTFADTLGTAYTLYFYLSSDYTGPNSFFVHVDGTGGLNLTNVASNGFHRYSTSFIGTGSDTILFGFQDDASFLRLDDVSFTDAGLGGPGSPVVPGVTPEPAGIVLLGTGLLGMAGLVRLRGVRA